MDKALGRGKYTDDLELPNMACAALVRCPYSHAKVLSIDVSEAEKVPGFLGCALPEEAPQAYFNCSGNPPSPLLMADEKVLTTEPLTIGDRVAVVAAETEEAARAAAEAVKVEYENLAPILDVKAALADNAPAMQPHLSDTNVVQRREVSQGDIAVGEEKSDIILEDHFVTPPMQHTMIELTCCICDFSDGEHMTIYSCSQTVFQERRILAELFGLKEVDVHIIKPLVGAGFGARQQLHAQHAAALISRKVGRPVKLIYTREEEFYSVMRHASDVNLRIGADKNGKLQLFDTTFRLNAGPYTTHTPTVVAAAARKLQYNVPNYSFLGLSVFTNDITGGAFRGYGNTQLTFGREILMDRLAQKLNMDPVEFRLMNHVQVGECFPCASIPVSSNGIEDCARRCQQIQKEIDKKEPLIDNDDIRQAWGIAFSCHGSGPSSKEGLSGAILMLNADATVHLLVGSADIGQGSETMESQIAAECLGIPLSSVQITAADTGLTPYNTGTFGSSQTFICGNAVKLACDDLKKKMVEQLKVIYDGCTVKEKDHRYYIGGGTDIMPLLKNEVRDDKDFVFLKKIPELHVLEEKDGELIIGAAMTLTELAESALLNSRYAAIAQASSLTASPQIRNIATVGGNIMQDRRCIYFNQPHLWRSGLACCFKTGGSICHQIPNSPVCRAIYYSDVATALIAYEAEVEYIEDGETHRTDLKSLIERHSVANGLACHEHLPILVTRFLVPAAEKGERSGFYKYAMRTTIDFPLINFALCCGGGKAAKIVAGAVAPHPVVLEETAKALDSGASDEEVVASAQQELKKLAMPIKEACIPPAIKRDLYRQISVLLDRRK